MLIAYCDESGEGGVHVLATVIVQDTEWLATLDAWTDYRRWLRDEFGLPIVKGRGRRKPVEVHATDLVGGNGDWRGLRLGRDARMRAFRVGLRLIGRHTKVFAVAWDPTRRMQESYRPYHEKPALDVWRTTLERLVTFSRVSAENQHVMAITDAGYGELYRRAFRKMRRHHRVGSMVGGTLTSNAPMFVDDPVVRDSKESAFVQMADLCAYAALRELRPRPPAEKLWSELGDGVVAAVNRYMRSEPAGIKVMPPR